MVSTKKPPLQRWRLSYGYLDCFNDRLSLTRQQWMPQCGHGSQSTEYKANQFVFEAAIKLADEKIEDQEWLYKDEDE